MAKTVLITGASKGIGAATAALFAKKGYNTVIGYNRSNAEAEALTRKLQSLGCNVAAYSADLSNPDSAKPLVDYTIKTFGGIDVLVNNAGIAQQKLFTNIENCDWDKMLAANLSSVFYCCRAAVPHFVHQKSGSIVNISSMWGVTGASCEVHYSAAKAGVIGLTKALAKELGPSGIRVNCVAPGTVDTPMNSHLSREDISALCEETPLCRIGTAEEIAEAIYFLSDGGSFITGQILGVNGGFVI